jgi:c-di-AMP phosphodiesterase-like protein
MSAKYKLWIYVITLTISVAVLIYALVVALVLDIKEWQKITIILPVFLVLVINFLIVLFVVNSLTKKSLEYFSKKLNIDRDDSLLFGEIGNIIIDDTNHISMITGIIEKRLGQKVLTKSINSVSEKLTEVMETSSEVNIKIQDSFYAVKYNSINKVFTLRDISEKKVMENHINDNRNVVMLLHIDNWESNYKNNSEGDFIQLGSQVKKAIYDWSKQFKILTRSYSEDSYISFLKYSDYEKITEDKFSIVDSVREIAKANGQDMTLSIAVSFGETDLSVLHDICSEALTLALNRGGGQVVIKEHGQPANFIGSTSEVGENFSGVEIKFFTREFISKLKSYKNVVIMGHKHGDFDLIGSALAIAWICKQLSIGYKIVINTKTLEIKARESIKMLSKESARNIVSPEEWHETYSKEKEHRFLLVAVDVSDKYWIEDSSIVDLASESCIIDHHIVKEAIIKSETKYIDSSASSTVEITTQIIDNSNLNTKNLVPHELDVMMAGMITDSNNFRLRTNNKTFWAASKLREWGFSPIRTNELLKDTLEDFQLKSKIFSSAFAIKENILVVSSPTDIIVEPAFLAQIADNVLATKKIEAVFVVGKLSSTIIGVSARSSGKINVMVIAEKLGGGGHFNAAACQLKNTNMLEAIELVKKAIDKDV